MAGFVPAIHVFCQSTRRKSWMPGTSPGMTLLVCRYVLVRPVHLARCRQNGLRGVDLGDQLPAPAGLFLVERLLFGALAERGDIHRLEELVVVFPHGALATIVNVAPR